jgi:hypothetical protein
MPLGCPMYIMFEVGPSVDALRRELRAAMVLSEEETTEESEVEGVGVEDCEPESDSVHLINIKI